MLYTGFKFIYNELGSLDFCLCALEVESEHVQHSLFKETKPMTRILFLYCGGKKLSRATDSKFII